MTTRFRNPWVDPRVLHLRPADAESYLRAAGWQEDDCAPAGAKRFVSSSRDGDREAVLVPVVLDDGPLLNLLVECVGRVAAWEGRYAGVVLDELLGRRATAPVNGRAAGST